MKHKPGVVPYTQRGQRAFDYAVEMAKQAGQIYLMPEHLLSGLLRESDNAAYDLLRRVSVDPNALQAELNQRILQVSPIGVEEAQITPRTQRVLRLAWLEAQRMNWKHVGPEHLLLGLMREGEGLPARMLACRAVSLEILRVALGFPSSEVEKAGRDVVLDHDEEVTQLLAVLKREGRLRKPEASRGGTVTQVIILSPLLIFSAMGILTMLVDGKLDADLLLFLGMFILGLFGLINATASRRQLAAAQRLVEIADKRAIGYLLEFRTWPFSDLAYKAQQVAFRLLPELRTEDARFLNSYQRLLLYRMVHPQYATQYPGYLITALKAIGQVGDQEAMYYVRSLLNLPGISPKGREVREAAQACFALLKARAEGTLPEATLLRPATETRSEHELLRPSEENPEAVPEELLRPVVEKI